jgi:hypothetical protein
MRLGDALPAVLLIAAQETRGSIEASPGDQASDRNAVTAAPAEALAAAPSAVAV